MASGKDSPQYKIVTENYEDIINALEANNGACKTLRRKLKAKEWLRAAENPPAEKLVTIIQNLIRRDNSDYDVFMDMLHDTVGMDQIAKKLQLPGRNCIVLYRKEEKTINKYNNFALYYILYYIIIIIVIILIGYNVLYSV